MNPKPAKTPRASAVKKVAQYVKYDFEFTPFGIIRRQPRPARSRK